MTDVPIFRASSAWKDWSDDISGNNMWCLATYLLRGRQVWILEDQVAVYNSPTRIPKIFFTLSYLPEALGVEARCVG